jgi:hypothetical protein
VIALGIANSSPGLVLFHDDLEDVLRFHAIPRFWH